MTTANKPTLRAWLIAHHACAPARDWAAAHPAPTVEACPVGEWLLWLAPLLGYSQAEQDAAVRPARLRALRVYVPQALDAAGLHDQAQLLRSLPDDINREESAAAAWAVEAPEAVWTARAAARAAEARKAAVEAAWAARAARTAVWAEAARTAVWAGAARAAKAAARAARAAARAEAAEAEAAEHALCAQDVRAAFPDLQQRLDAALETM